MYIIAGPNGSGKTTFATQFLPAYANCPRFINADLIAQGLSPFKPRTVAIKSRKLVLEQIHEYMDKGCSFGFETTLSGKLYLKLFEDMKTQGYRLHIFYLWIPTTRLALARIKNRVAEGGHPVPAGDVRRRFERSLTNFFGSYQAIANDWTLFDNSSTRPLMVAKRSSDKLEIFDQTRYNEIAKFRD